MCFWSNSRRFILCQMLGTASAGSKIKGIMNSKFLTSPYLPHVFISCFRILTLQQQSLAWYDKVTCLLMLCPYAWWLAVLPLMRGYRVVVGNKAVFQSCYIVLWFFYLESVLCIWGFHTCTQSIYNILYRTVRRILDMTEIIWQLPQQLKSTALWLLSLTFQLYTLHDILINDDILYDILIIWLWC